MSSPPCSLGAMGFTSTLSTLGGFLFEQSGHVVGSISVLKGTTLSSQQPSTVHARPLAVHHGSW